MFPTVSSLPLAQDEVLATHSGAEYARWCADHGVPTHVRPVWGSGEFHVRLHRRKIPGGILEVAMGGAAAAHVQDAGTGEYFQALLPVSGRGRLRTSARDLDLRGDHSGALVAPRAAHNDALSDRWCDLSIYVHPTVLEAALTGWLGRPHPVPLASSTALLLREKGSRTLLALSSLLFREAEEGASDERLAALLERWCVGLVRAMPRLGATLAQADFASASRRHVHAAEEFMEANLARPLRVTELATTTGVGLRALQKAFQKHRGVRPLEALKEMRLERVRTRLLQEPGLPIADAARSAGTAHLGRLSVEYRARFGETPSETRKRARATPIYRALV